MDIIFNLWIFLWLFVLTVMPFIICGILVGIIIHIVQTKLIKSKVLKILIVISILLGVGIALINTIKERPSEQYVKMEEINHNKNLIGLSEEQVIELLGKPIKIYTYNNIDKKVYMYSAGYITEGTRKHSYVLKVIFEGTDKVTSTVLKERP